MKKTKVLLASLMMVLLSAVMVFAEGHEAHHTNLGETLPIWSVIPFVCMLLSIAIVPLVKPHWWEHNLLKVALFWAAVFLVPFGVGYGVKELTFQVLEIVLLDYLPFIVLLLGLFVAAGGIAIKGTIAGTPKMNLILLLMGTLLASWVGTTGAAMLMIRPVIRANAWREKKAHIKIFFIFLVANIGGCLTPVGDPPLFLGFLRGVPFFWTMKLLPILGFAVAVLGAIFFVIDTVLYKKELAAGRVPIQENVEREPIKIEGAHNFIFIVMVVGSVILNGLLSSNPMFANPETGELYGLNIGGVVLPFTSIVQMSIILVAAGLSMKTTRKETREANAFTFAPIEEVAQLFIGIFITMIPALALLKAHGSELGLEHPYQFFWATGMLSGFLDNAPTYLVFLTTAGGAHFADGVHTTVGTVPPLDLMAISAGAVFMGALTYIGNAPNFMVKAIAEENKIKMPSFFGYMAWSFGILIPLFILITVVFFLHK